MLRVAIIGCGKIADAHAAHIQHIEGCEIVGVCDREPLMAQQLYERFPIKAHFSDVNELLTKAAPDVVHITTPPQSHYALAKLCLEYGCHVYVEKPFTIDLGEAERLIALAQQRSLKLTVGHNDQFSHVAMRMRALVRDGYLGGTPLHMESYYGYDLGDVSYARALLGDKQHWVRQLPGKLLQNVISHGIARIAEFWVSDHPQVVAIGFPSSLLKSIGEKEIFDELRVMITDREQTAYFTFSSRMRPLVHQLRLFGPRNGLLLDQDHELLIKLEGRALKSYTNKFVPPLRFAKQHFKNVVGNLSLFAKRQFHMDAGLRHLIASFYNSIVCDGNVPISYEEILITARIMDEIFAQLKLNNVDDCQLSTSH
jgi:predicted dehydrogenase